MAEQDWLRDLGLTFSFPEVYSFLRLQVSNIIIGSIIDLDIRRSLI